MGVRRGQHGDDGEGGPMSHLVHHPPSPSTALHRLSCCLALCVLLAPPVAAQQGFTLEQVMSAPFPSDLTAAGRGGRFAWVQDDRGMRNIWVAEAPGYQGRQLTRYAEDDGQELT